MLKRDYIRRARTGVKLGLKAKYEDRAPLIARGDVFFDLRDARTKEPISVWEKKNIIVLDAGILLARLCRDPSEPAHGINMLAVGTGALGNLLNPDAPPIQQRSLNNEIARKGFSSITFRDGNGVASANPTHVLDFTTIFSESEAVGPLNEMALLSTVSGNPAITNPNPNLAGQGGQPYDPSIDVTLYDMEVNYLTFAVISKPATSILSITWRLTF